MKSARRLLAFVTPYRREAILSLVLLAALVCLDLAIPRLIQRLIDHGIARGDRALVLHTALLMLGISALSTLIAIGNNVYSVRVGEGVARDLREALFLKIQSYSFAELDQQKTGNLLVRLTSDVNAVKGLIQISLRIGTRAPLMIVGSLVLMISTSARLALIMVPLLLVTATLIGFFILKTEPLVRSVQGKLDLMNGVLQENIAGARLVKSLVRGPFEEQRFARTNNGVTEKAIAVMQFMSAMMPALTLCINVGMVVVIWVGGLDAIQGRLSVGQIVAFTNYMLSTMTPLVMMTMLSNMWAAGLVSAARVEEVLGNVPRIADASDAIDLAAGPGAGRVVFDAVSFVYEGDGNAAVLSELALDVRPGQTIAILGATGAGKSTLVNLIPRFYDVTAGAVRVGEPPRDVRSLKQDSLLGQIGLVPQQSLLFSGTISENIRYGRPDASDAQVRAAAQAAQADEFIQQLPGGYQARVEARGANFSGGQKQRLAIARALLLEPAVLILDDSTSAVDVETETRIQDALVSKQTGTGTGSGSGTEALSRPRTTFVVAQRISTVLKADQILVLERGRIVAAGTHQQLMRSSPVYREIYDSQLGGGIAQSAGSPADEAIRGTPS